MCVVDLPIYSFFQLKMLVLKIQDIDIVVSEEDLDPEDIKEAIVESR
jgi:hypothetical protein